MEIFSGGIDTSGVHMQVKGNKCSPLTLFYFPWKDCILGFNSSNEATHQPQEKIFKVCVFEHNFLSTVSILLLLFSVVAIINN